MTARRDFERHETLDPGFPLTQDARFLKALIETVEIGDPDTFATVCRNYDEWVVRLDGWRTFILLKIKETISEEPELT